MNELYAADPAVCKSALELKLLFSSFGPYVGRYLANYPNDWIGRVELGMSSAHDIEIARIQTLLRRAKENLILVTKTNLQWNSDQEWLSNAAALLNGSEPVFKGLIAQSPNLPAIYSLHDVNLPPTAEERVKGVAAEYVRISKILLLLSQEIAFIDPYLNPCKRNCAPVLKALMAEVARGKCRKLSIWVRSAEVLDARSSEISIDNLKDDMLRLAKAANFKSGCQIELIFIEDESCQTKMHGRYVLSIKGGIRLDQGFQELPQGRHVDVGPVGKVVHDQLLDIYFDNRHDMRIKHRIPISL